MSNPANNHNFVNPAFAGIFEGVTAYMPHITFYGVIATYAITALLNVFFIPLPLFVSIPAAVAIAFTRFAIVFMDFLNPTGRRSPWPGMIATGLTLMALVELGFSIQEFGWGGAKFWASFLFGATIIAGGYLLEINFIAKGAEAFGLGKANPAAQGVLSAQASQVAAFQQMQSDLAGLKAENQFLKNQQHQAAAATPPTPDPQGNGQAPQPRTKNPNPALANQGHQGNNPTGTGSANPSMNHHGA
jgi:hypothetical protein